MAGQTRDDAKCALVAGLELIKAAVHLHKNPVERKGKFNDEVTTQGGNNTY